jgi:nucleoporin GLE1
MPASKTRPAEETRRLQGRREGESDDQFYNRTAGYVALYAAFCTADIPGHPHGMEAAWRWLARVLNMTPRRVTAVMLLAFLEVGARPLQRAFPRQFPKLVRFVRGRYVPAMLERKEKPPTDIMSRLQTLLAS